MTLETLGSILQDSSLDRETKLAVIDLVARVPDDDLVRDVMELLESWRAADKAEQAGFLRELEKIENAYRARVAKISQTGIRAARLLSDEAQTQSEAAILRAKIESIYAR